MSTARSGLGGSDKNPLALLHRLAIQLVLSAPVRLASRLLCEPFRHPISSDGTADFRGGLTLAAAFAILRAMRRFDLSLRARGSFPNKYG